MVRSNKNGILTIPDVEIADEVVSYGASTGQSTEKIAKLGIGMREVPDSEIRILLHSRVALRCSLKGFVETGDHYLYICKV